MAFLTGHGERSIDGIGERDYYAFSQYKDFRNSLVNQGFESISLSLDSVNKVPENIDILVISDVRTALSPKEQEIIENYIAEGRNLLIAGEPRRQEQMNPLLAPLGLSFMPGILVQESKDFSTDLILANPTMASLNVINRFDKLLAFGNQITMPSAVGIKQTEEKGFKVVPILTTDSTGSWNELETTDFIDDTVCLNPAIGEVEKIYNTVVALSRKVGNKEQKIILTGDADCISNGEFGRRVPTARASNFSLITGGFFWMSDNEVPIDVRRPALPDNKVYVEKTGSKVIKWSFMIVLPLLLAGIGIFLWIRRKGR